MPSHSLAADPKQLERLVALSLMRGGLDASAARAARSVLREQPASAWLRTVATEVWKQPHERAPGVQWARVRAPGAIEIATARGYGVLTCLDASYSSLLNEIPDPPIVLWTSGRQQFLHNPAVAVVGSRKPGPASLEIAKALGRGLAEAGLTVVSGLARGVDAAAHVGALEAGGATIAVIGSGLTHTYPKQNAWLTERIRKEGLIVSELHPSELPMPRHFPLRNRIISGLSRATVVVEAGRKSGSLITARLAGEQNRDVLAVPGSPFSGCHAGCNRLIKDGARLVETVEDVLQELNWVSPGPILASNGPDHLQLGEVEANMAKGEPYSVDQLAARTGQSASELVANLCKLELSGRVTRTPEGRFVRLRGPAGGEDE